MPGEYQHAPSARGRSGQRTRGRQAEHADAEYDGYPGSGADAGSGADGFGEVSAGPGGPGTHGPPASAAQQDPQARARQVCLRLLTLAPRTRAQLADALRKRGIPDDVSDEVLGRFTDAGLIDDAAFARAWVDSRHHGRGLSGRALTAELRQRGVDEGQIKEAIEELGPGADVETARRLVERKLAATLGQAPEARVRRLAGMLARKGYPPGLAFRVIREALESEGTQDEATEGLVGDELPDDLDPE